MASHLPLPVALAASLASSAAHAAPAEQRWYAISAETGERFGWSSVAVSKTPDGRETVAERRLLLREPEGGTVQLVERSVVRANAAGETVFLSEEVRTGRHSTRTEARIEGGKARIVRQAGRDSRSAEIALPAGVRFDLGEGLLAGWAGAPRRIAFDNFDAGAMAVEQVVLEPSAPLPGDPAGVTPLLRKRYEKAALRSVSRLLVDAEGRVVLAAQPMFGTAFVTRRTDETDALRRHAPFNMLRTAMMKSPFRISPGALSGRIRFRFDYRPGFAFTLPETGEQRAVPDGEGARIDICGDCGPGLPAGPAALAEALQATAWLQSDHPRLRALAEPVARMDVSGRRKMELLLRRAEPYLAKVEFTGHYSALDTLDRRAGDCTEAAVLLAALGRAAGIPTKVANGLVYSRERYHGVGNVFMPHSWTLAYVDGAWRSFDLALGGFDASHIALTVGDGDPRSIAAAGALSSLLRWRDMAEVRAKPAS